MIVPDSLYILTSSPELAPETTIQPALPYILILLSYVGVTPVFSPSKTIDKVEFSIMSFNFMLLSVPREDVMSFPL